MSDRDETIKYTADVVVTTTDGYVLLIKRGSAPYEGTWALPGGHVNKGETGRKAAVRELAEEAGVGTPLEELRQVGVFDDPGRDPRGRYVSVAFHLVLVRRVPLKADDDAVEARWWFWGELPPLAFDHEQIINAVLNGTCGP